MTSSLSERIALQSVVHQGWQQVQTQVLEMHENQFPEHPSPPFQQNCWTVPGRRLTCSAAPCYSYSAFWVAHRGLHGGRGPNRSHAR
jgi:hypothetical protein